MNILIPTYWSYKDPLIQTYTLPYVRIISKYIGKEDKIYLQTLEKKGLKLSEEELKNEKEKLAEDKIYLVSLKYSIIFDIYLL